MTDVHGSSLYKAVVIIQYVHQSCKDLVSTLRLLDIQRGVDSPRRDAFLLEQVP